jgi:O-antigen biosynthesis protein
MSDAIPVSVVIASRGRPDALLLCLAGLRQQDHPAFEVVVVADPAGLAAADGSALAGQLRKVAFDEANISAARNAGIRQAAGAVCAFIDDDAVPEPTWLSRLVAPFHDRRVAAAGGFVLGRNGISFQWKAQAVDPAGRTRPLDLAPDADWSLPVPPGNMAVKTEGTNMAVRRGVLVALGGFDPAYRFYLDETDLNLRLAAARATVALVPLARVHHGYSASDRRRGDRTPLSLFEIGASQAVFLRRHLPPGPRAAQLLAGFRDDQRRRLLRFMVRGGLEPRDVGRLMQTLDDGISEGQSRMLPDLVPLGPPQAPFRPVSGTGPRPGRVFAGWRWQRSRLHAAAQTAVAEGALVTVFRFGLLPFRHRMRFHPSGFWEQTGGLWARSDREGPAPGRPGLAARLAQEVRRIAPHRPVDTLAG